MKLSALALLTIVCAATLYPTDSSDDDKKHVESYLRSCSSDEVSNTSKNTMRDKLGVRNGFRNRMSRQSPYQQRNCHEQERLWVEATIAQSSYDDITYYFNENLQNNFYSEHELFTWYDLYAVPAYCAYIASLPGYEQHIHKVREQLYSDTKTAKKTAKAMGLKLNAARELVDQLYNEVRQAQSQRKYQQQCQQAQAVKALHRQTIQYNQQEVMALEQDARAAIIEDWKARIDDAPDALVARYKKRMSAASCNVWHENAYSLSSPMHAVFADQQIDPDRYTMLYGNELQQVLQAEFVEIVNQIAPMHMQYGHIPSMQGLVTFAVQMADIGVAYNKEGATARASLIADASWAALDCIAAAVEGLEEGIINTVDMVMHPLETVCSLGRGIKALGNYHFAMMVAIGDAELYKDTDYRCPPDSLHQKIIRMQQVHDRFHAAAGQLKARDCVKGVSLFATEWALQARILQAVGALAGKSAKTLLKCAEKIADLVPKPKLVLSLPEAIHIEVVEQIIHAAVVEERLFNLVKKAENVYVSLAGLIYGPDNIFGNRLHHVLEHTKEILGKTKHTVFNVAGEELFNLIDEAWLKRGLPVPGNSKAYDIVLNKVIGTQGETAIRIVIVPGTTEVITAYPIKV